MVISRPCPLCGARTGGSGKTGVMTEVLVTGAAGRVGQQLLPGLRERFDLRLMDRVPVDGADSGARILVGELTDRRLLNDAVAGVDAIVHLAGNPDPEASWQDLRNPNVEGFAGLLAASRDHGVRRVIFASSVHAMGGYDGRRRWPIDPGWPPAPCCSIAGKTSVVGRQRRTARSAM